MKTFVVALLLFISGSCVISADTGIAIPMQGKGTAVFHVEVDVEGVGCMDFLVDTGAGYMTINENILATLKRKGLATYIKDLQGILADGTSLIVPVYEIASINIGGSCKLRKVHAAVFPGATRGLLGLSVLQRTAPFEFSVEPPMLKLSNCIDGNSV